MKQYYKKIDGIADKSRRYNIVKISESDFTGDHPNDNHMSGVQYIPQCGHEGFATIPSGEIAAIGEHEGFATIPSGEIATIGEHVVHDVSTGLYRVLDYENSTVRFDDQWEECESEITPTLSFEIAMKNVIQQHLQHGLTVTEAIGTLQLCQLDIKNLFDQFNV